jgi:hypothetical protein
MNAKNTLAVLLLIFVAGSLAYMAVREGSTGGPSGDRAGPAAVTEDPPKPAGLPQGGDVVVVYYFHGRMRCPTCRKLESYAREAVRTFFPDELSTGRIRWQAVNVDVPDNEHFVRDYRLTTKAVVLSRLSGGRQANWKNLDRIWDLVGDKDKYIQYICNGIREFLAQDSP